MIHTIRATSIVTFVFELLFFALAPNTVLAISSSVPELDWISQIGDRNPNFGLSVASDNGAGLYVTGSTWKSANLNSVDPFLAKWDVNGSLLWTREHGSASRDEAVSVAVDGVGGIYITGFTEGQLVANGSQGGRDAFLLKYNQEGTLLWERQFGTNKFDEAFSVAVADDGAVFVVGRTSGNLDGLIVSGTGDGFLKKFDSAGNQQWTRLFGNVGFDAAYSVTTDALGSIFVGGTTERVPFGNPSGFRDAFVNQYANDGSLLWTRSLNDTALDRATSVASDGEGGAYVGWIGESNVAAVDDDAFLTRVSPTGSRLWTKSLITAGDDQVNSVTSDGDGGVYVGGSTGGDLGGNDNAGRSDAFIAHYAPEGDNLWTQLLGTDDIDIGFSVDADEQGGLYLTGWTYGSFAGTPRDFNADIFVARYDVIPEASSLTLVTLGLMFAVRRPIKSLR